jgi:hypothetical protein
MPIAQIVHPKIVWKKSAISIFKIGISYLKTDELETQITKRASDLRKRESAFLNMKQQISSATDRIEI